MRKKAGLLFLIKISKIPLNLLLLLLTAKYFGVSVEKDVWLLAFTTMTVIDAALWGPINETFRTKFIFVKENESADLAIAMTQSLITYFILFSLLIIGIIIIFPDYFAGIIAPNYTAHNKIMLIEMLYLVAPVLMFNQLMQIGNSILNAHEIFFVGELASIISSIVNIILLYFFAKKIGITSLALSYYVSTLLLIIFIIFFINKKNIPLFKNKWNIGFQGFKVFFAYALSFFLPYFFGQINNLIEKILAGKIKTGAVSIIDFSNKIPNLLYGFVISVITTLLVPVLAKHFVRGEQQEYTSEFKKIFHSGLLFVSALVGFFCASSFPVVNLLYNKGSITEADLSQIAQLSTFYAFSIIGIYLYIIFGMSLMSSGNQKYYAFMGMLAQMLVIVLNILLSGWVGIKIFPISILISHTFFGWIMYKRFPFKDHLQLEKKYFIVVVLVISISYFFIQNIQFSGSIFLSLGIQVLCLLLTLFIISSLFRLEEINLVSQYFKKIYMKYVSK